MARGEDTEDDPTVSGRVPSVADRAPAGARRKTAQEALADARAAEIRRQKAGEEAERMAQEKRDLARRVADEARQRIDQQRREAEARKASDARKHAEEAKKQAEEAKRRAERQAEDADAQAARDRAATRPRGGGRAAATGPNASPLPSLLAEGKLSVILERMGDDFEILEVFTELRADVLAVLWQGHTRRARHEKDFVTMVVAQHLANVLQSQTASLLAARVAWGDREWAVFVDTERKEVLAALAPAERYLTGL